MSSYGPLLVGIVSHSHTKVFWLLLLVILSSKYGPLVVDIVGYSLIKACTVVCCYCWSFSYQSMDRHVKLWTVIGWYC